MRSILISAILFSSVAAASELDQVKSLLDKYYVKDITDTELEKAAIKGIISSLDPHSHYIDKDEFKELYEQNSYIGIGIEITISKEYPLIISVSEKSPAEKVGLKKGDIIISVDGKKLYGVNIQTVRDILKGKSNSSVNLVILRNNQEIEFNIIRKKINIVLSSVKLLDDIAYIRIKHFSNGVTDNVRKAYDAIDQSKIKGVIIDMRYNPGGLLNEAINMSSLFLDKQSQIISIRGKNSKDAKKFFSSGNNIANGLPIVVVINSNSASAAEIVAGALQDHKRAIVVGTKSFGKGSVQNTFKLKNSDVIKLTTALYYTPNGYVIQGNGIIPDVIVEDEMVLEKLPSIGSFSENSFENKLPDDLFEKKVQDIQKIQLYKSKILGDAESDFQLMRAIDVIRTMNFYHKNS